MLLKFKEHTCLHANHQWKCSESHPKVVQWWGSASLSPLWLRMWVGSCPCTLESSVVLLGVGRDGAVVIALASHHCGLGSNPRPGVISGLSLLLLWGFFSGFSGFPPSTKINISKFQLDREFEGHGFVSRMTVKCYPHKNKVDLFIYQLKLKHFVRICVNSSKSCRVHVFS